MKEIWLIIKREYYIRISKKSFLIMTLAAPLFIGAILLAPGMFSKIFDQEQIVEVLDESSSIKLPDLLDIKYIYIKGPLEPAKNSFKKGPNDALLYIPGNDNYAAVKLFTLKKNDVELKQKIEQSLQSLAEESRLLQQGIDKEELSQIKEKLSIQSVNLSKGRENYTNPVIVSSLGIFFCILIHIFIFTYGSQVMAGVIEEKTNRIVEVLICSIRPFQLMIGKILGIVGVGLTQFLAWVFLLAAILLTAPLLLSDASEFALIESTAEIQQVLDILKSIDLMLILTSFIIYFIGGYLIYASLFAVIGSAVEKEADTQQFVMPVTSPLILSLLTVQYIIKDPDGTISFWMSLFPLTSPIIMMMRLPFGGVTTLELVSSITLLVVSFIVTTWIAAKIYRVGILSTGKKASYKDLIKWFAMKV